MKPYINWYRMTSQEIKEVLKEGLEQARDDDAVHTVADWAHNKGLTNEVRDHLYN